MDKPNAYRPDSELDVLGTRDNAKVPTWLPPRDWRGALDSRYSVIALFRLRYSRWTDESDYIEIGLSACSLS